MQKQRRFINHFKTLLRHLNYNVVLSTKRRRCSDVLITTSFYQQYSNIFLTSFLQRRFINNITTSLGHLLTILVFTTLLQRHGMVERHCDVKTTIMQRCQHVVCLQGWFKLCLFFLSKFCNCKFIHPFSLQLKISYHTKGVFRNQTNISNGTIPLQKKQRPTS